MNRIGKIIVIFSLLFVAYFTYEQYWSEGFFIGHSQEDLQPIDHQGVIVETNVERNRYGLGDLRDNSVLREAAEMKANDMLQRQYFAHTSPSGATASDLVEYVGYNYILVGENLSLGNFDSARDMVNSWMNSPGHKANILNPRYQEIGVATVSGLYEGNNVWIGVQIFGRPADDCPSPSDMLKQQIDQKKAELNKLGDDIDRLKKDLPKTTSEYNRLVNQYNAISPELASLVNTYNKQVEEYNLCLK